MQEKIQFNFKFENPHETSQRRKAVCMREMSTELHPICPLETAQAAAQQRAALHLRLVRQVLHLGLGSPHTLEDHQVRAVPSGGGHHGREVTLPSATERSKLFEFEI